MGPPVTNRRKAGTTSSHHGPYVLGHTRATMAGTERGEAARQSGSQKAGLSTDWSLQLDSTKLESLVIAHQHGAVNTFPGLVHTARHTIRAGGTRTGRCGWITSFLRRKGRAMGSQPWRNIGALLRGGEGPPGEKLTKADSLLFTDILFLGTVAQVVRARA